MVVSVSMRIVVYVEQMSNTLVNDRYRGIRAGEQQEGPGGFLHI